MNLEQRASLPRCDSGDFDCQPKLFAGAIATEKVPLQTSIQFGPRRIFSGSFSHFALPHQNTGTGIAIEKLPGEARAEGLRLVELDDMVRTVCY